MIWRRRHAALRGDALPTATDVRSELSSTGDSLQVIVSWQLDATSGERAGRLRSRGGRPGRRPHVADPASARVTSAPTPCDCPRPRRARRPAGTPAWPRCGQPDCPAELYPLAVRPADGRGAGASGSPRRRPPIPPTPRSDRRRPPRRPWRGSSFSPRRSRWIPTWEASAPPGSARTPDSTCGSTSTARPCPTAPGPTEANGREVLCLRDPERRQPREDGHVGERPLLRAAVPGLAPSAGGLNSREASETWAVPLTVSSLALT